MPNGNQAMASDQAQHMAENMATVSLRMQMFAQDIARIEARLANGQETMSKLSLSLAELPQRFSGVTDMVSLSSRVDSLEQSRDGLVPEHRWEMDELRALRKDVTELQLARTRSAGGGQWLSQAFIVLLGVVSLVNMTLLIWSRVAPHP